MRAQLYQILTFVLVASFCSCSHSHRTVSKIGNGKSLKSVNRSFKKAKRKETKQYPNSLSAIELYLQLEEDSLICPNPKPDTTIFFAEDRSLLEQFKSFIPVHSSLAKNDSLIFFDCLNNDSLSSYIGYVECFNFVNNYNERAHDSIYNKMTPSKYLKVDYTVKINEFVHFLDDKRNLENSNFQEALWHLYLLVTSSGFPQDFRSFEQSRYYSFLESDPFFLKDFQRTLDYAFEAQVILNSTEPSEVELEIIKGLWPREAAYQLIQKNVRELILNREFQVAATEVKDISTFLEPSRVLPSMEIKLMETIELYGNSVITQNPVPWIQRKYELSNGSVRRPIETDNNKWVSVTAEGNQVQIAQEAASIPDGHTSSKHTSNAELVYASLNESMFSIRYDSELISTKSKDPALSIFDALEETAENHHKKVESKIEFIDGVNSEIKSFEDFWISESNLKLYAGISVVDTIETGNLVLSKSEYSEDDSYQKMANLDLFIMNELSGANFDLQGVNTRYSERTPFLKGDTLYFSSTGLAGYGGFDCYFSVHGENGWTKPENLGPVVNSPFDDMGYKCNPLSDCFESNRSGNYNAYQTFDFNQYPEKDLLIITAEILSLDKLTFEKKNVEVDVYSISGEKKMSLGTFISPSGNIMIPVVNPNDDGSLFLSIKSEDGFVNITESFEVLVEESIDVSDKLRNSYSLTTNNPTEQASEAGEVNSREIRQVSLGQQILNDIHGDGCYEILHDSKGNTYRFYFNTNESIPKDSLEFIKADLAIRTILELLRLKPKLSCQLKFIGYADITGDSLYCVGLGESRALFVADYFKDYPLNKSMKSRFDFSGIHSEGQTRKFNDAIPNDKLQGNRTVRICAEFNQEL